MTYVEVSGDRLASAKPSVLEVDSLNVSFASGGRSTHVLRDVSLSLRPGEILGIVGESGSGKSTLLSTILGLLPPQGRVSSGTVTYGGRNLLTASVGERRQLRSSALRLIPQRAMTSLSPVTSIRKQFAQIAKAAGQPVPSSAELSALLRRVGLSLDADRLKRYPHEFSGGQLQRMLIAASVLLGEPKIVFADEPTSTLDTTVQAQVLGLIRSLRSEVGASVMFVTHDLGVVAQLCDRVLVMYAGEIVENTDVDSLFHDPKHPYTRALLGSLADGHEFKQPLTAIAGRVSDSMELDVGCRFAPRCQSAFGRCGRDRPVDLQATNSLVKCHLYDLPHPGEE